MAYKLASEFIKRTASSLEPYLQMVRQAILKIPYFGRFFCSLHICLGVFCVAPSY